ncbi:ABI3 protein, partial [Nycticryphes semicollaris]|nr:ABI3 protein [Nycticryphes semicollaris]
ELEKLQQCDIPAGRQVLRDHHCNLLRVADYCESNYLQASDKRKALEETMALSTQSLASVTYQVSSLATTFLRLLDLQAAELRKVEADVSCVAQRVDMHKEKVSRREIGSLTVSKMFPSYQKIMPPPNPPCLEPYYRKPLNFSVLDDIGHGIKVSLGLGAGAHRGEGALHGLSQSPVGLSPCRRNTRVPEPIQPPVVPEGKLSAASSTSSLISVRCTEFVGWLQWPSPVVSPCLPVPAGPQHPAVPHGHPGSEGDQVVGPGCGHPGPPPAALPDFEDLVPPPPPATEDPPWAPESYLEKVVTLYPYTRQKDNELSFQPGTLLFITRRYSDGWCEGVMGEEAGFFPGNYVEPC